jgi:protein-disulfide isomerase
MSRQRIIVLSVLALAFIGVTALYFVQVWKESRTRFRAGLPIPQDIVPEELLSDEERVLRRGGPQAPEVRPEDPLLSGSDASPITVILVSDFQCGVCSDQAKALLDALRLTGRSSDIRVIWRDLPVTLEHSKALDAAVAGRCAARQGKFRAMFDLLAFESEAFDEDEFLRFARRANLSEQDFKVCIRDPAVTFAISGEVEDLRMLAIKEIPTLFVNGSPLAGYVDADTLAAVFRREISMLDD